MPKLNERGVTMICMSHAPIEKVDFDAVLADFEGDEGMAEVAASIGTDVAGYVTTEGPGFLAFALRDGIVHHTFTAYAPELNVLVFSQQLLERAPKGGDSS